MTCADHIASAQLSRIDPKIKAATLRRIAALLQSFRQKPKRKDKAMSWSIHITGSIADALKQLREMNIWRSKDTKEENPNADQCEGVRDALINAVQVMPKHFNAVMIESHGHVDKKNSCNFEVKFRGMHIEGLPMAINPRPVEVMNEPPAAPAVPTDSKGAGTTATAPTPVVAGAAAAP